MEKKPEDHPCPCYLPPGLSWYECPCSATHCLPRWTEHADVMNEVSLFSLTWLLSGISQSSDQNKWYNWGQVSWSTTQKGKFFPSIGSFISFLSCGLSPSRPFPSHCHIPPDVWCNQGPLTNIDLLVIRTVGQTLSSPDTTRWKRFR